MNDQGSATMAVKMLADADLLPCPFCGGAAKFERLGTARQSCIVACDNCGARLETGEIWNRGAQWNTRHPGAKSED